MCRGELFVFNTAVASIRSLPNMREVIKLYSTSASCAVLRPQKEVELPLQLGHDAFVIISISFDQGPSLVALCHKRRDHPHDRQIKTTQIN